MLAYCSGVGAIIDIRAIPKPDSISDERWLFTFPSFGFLLSVSPDNVPDVMERFRRRDISANDVGVITAERRVVITDGSLSETICDLSVVPLLGCGPRGVAA